MKYDKQTQKNFDILHNLNWPTDEYRVFGGGIMSALGIKPWRDIDLIVSEDLYEWIKKEYTHNRCFASKTELKKHLTKSLSEMTNDKSQYMGTMYKELQKLKAAFDFYEVKFPWSDSLPEVA